MERKASVPLGGIGDLMDRSSCFCASEVLILSSVKDEVFLCFLCVTIFHDHHSNIYIYVTS